MTRIPWKFGDYNWPVNPSESSGWVKEELMAENNPLNSTKSSIQFTATKSGRLQISGYILSQAQYTTMMGWKESGLQATLVDHYGVSKKARLIVFDAKPVNNVGNFKNGELVGRTWSYSAEFIEV